MFGAGNHIGIVCMRAPRLYKCRERYANDRNISLAVIDKFSVFCFLNSVLFVLIFMDSAFVFLFNFYGLIFKDQITFY